MKAMRFKKLFFAISICGVTHSIEPVKETLPPESESIQNAATGRTQLKYKGATPIIFFRKDGMVPSDSLIQYARLGVPTKSNESPVAKLLAERVYRFSFGRLTESGRIEGQDWEIEEGASSYPLVSETPPKLSSDVVSLIRNGKLEKKEELVSLPYYYGRELRKIDLKYVFKKIPGFDAKVCEASEPLRKQNL